MSHWQPIALFACAASCALGVFPVPASAAAPTQPVAAEGNPVLAETGDGASVSAQRAREHYARAIGLYDAGDLERALDEFERAQALRPSPQILFNVAQVQIRLQRYASAHRTLRRYLREGGDALSARRREDVDAQLAFLEQKTAHPSLRGRSVGISPRRERVRVDGLSLTPSAEVYAPRDVPRAPDRSLTQVVWISTGAALALGAAGTGLATLLTSRHYDDLRRLPGTPLEASATRSRLDRQRDLVESLAITTDVLTAAAVGAAAVSLYLELESDTDEPATSLSLDFAPRGLRVTGSF